MLIIGIIMYRNSDKMLQIAVNKKCEWIKNNDLSYEEDICKLFINTVQRLLNRFY